MTSPGRLRRRQRDGSGSVPLRSPTNDDGTAFDAIEWAVRLGVAVIFIDIGYEKVIPTAHSYWVKIFTDIGYGLWFMYLTGTLQIIGGLLMIAPRTAVVGAALLASTMVGAVLTHFFLLRTGFGGAVFPAAFLVLIGTAVRLRFRDRAGAQLLDLRE
jgi:putative oxidoreductase